MTYRKGFAIGAGVLLAILLLGMLWAWRSYSAFLSQPVLSNAQKRVVIIKPGTAFRSIVAQIVPSHDRRRIWAWTFLAFKRAAARTIKAGEYEVQPGMRPEQLLQDWIDGRVIQYRFTIIEGWEFKQLRQSLLDEPIMTGSLSDADIDQFMVDVGRAGQSPEGLFLPETYLYPRHYARLDLLRQAYDAMQKTLHEAWNSRLLNLPLKDPYAVLILASIVEKETAVFGERAQIAGVFMNRLLRGMRLETDPTVIYGLGTNYHGNLRRQDLRTVTPYNTYTNAGLPPTPISLPGAAAIKATVRPDENEYLYFVARGDGTHQFSTSFAQHSNAVRRFQRKKRVTAKK